ncbi:MAG: hypothetical protein KDC71_23320 [Acidobacteria bacterium]|nr:hypothetical protein [Acidobacteriota bacterium]
MKYVAWGILLVLAILWLLAIITGMIVAFPFGLIGLLGLFAMGLLFAKVLKERMENKEDDYYDKHVDQ